MGMKKGNGRSSSRGQFRYVRTVNNERSDVLSDILKNELGNCDKES